MNQHPSQGENWCRGIQKAAQIQHPRKQPQPLVNHRALNCKGDGPQWHLQHREVCCQGPSLLSLSFWRGEISALSASGFPPYPMSGWSEANRNSQLLISNLLIAHLCVLNSVACFKLDCQLQWSLSVPFWKAGLGSLVWQRRLSVLYSHSLVSATSKDQGTSIREYPSLPSLCFVISCCRSVFSFAVQSFPFSCWNAACFVSNVWRKGRKM